ncbi:MAG: hypothetical protein HN352_02715 [Bacteroidetes bacterium]|jgi:hypothetical protein|nr:hypothetical protein [Bacteroidota bacterium]MBT3749809.1 hypothetical protein [Bacteroidota bacterium]MBT4399787.1 hypothetical protein [Bacteroidota bacterium]MBT4410310.1 hypothetical protein [Bacteroidota bacterium]MBT5428000.1 hypothetical protein [Bacteroidota bacterium]
MEQKDYLLRQLEMIGPMIMYMLGIWREGRINDALDYGAESLENLTALPLNELDVIHQDDIVKFLTEEKELLAGQVRIIAEFLYRIGEIRHKEDFPIGRETLLKARRLIEWHELTTGVFSFEVQNMKKGIEQMLTG